MFHATHGLLPLTGTVPDMAADSTSYARLHAVFADKAKQDLSEVAAAVATCQADTAAPVPEEFIKLLCTFVVLKFVGLMLFITHKHISTYTHVVTHMHTHITILNR